MKTTLILLMCSLYLVNYFVHNSLLQIVLSFTALLVFMATIQKAKTLSKIMGLILVVSGMLVDLIVNQHPFIDSLAGLQKNLPILTLILFAPLIAVPLHLGGYLEGILDNIKKTRDDPSKTFLGITGILSIIAPMLNIGSIKIMDNMIHDMNMDSRLRAKAYFVGFSTAMAWSPYFGSIGLIMFYTNVKVNDFILIGLTFAAVQFIIGNLLFYWSNPKRKEPGGTSLGRLFFIPSRETILCNLKLILILLTLITTIIVLEFVTQISMIILVSVISIVFLLLYGLTKAEWGRLKKELLQYTRNLETGANSEVVLFLSAGLFGSAVSQTKISHSIGMLTAHLSSISFLLFVLLLLLTIMILAILGIHQIITVPILALQINPAVIGTTPEILAFIFVLAWFLSSIFSPVNAINILISNAVKESPFTVGIKWNGLYVLIMLLIGLIFILILQQQKFHHLF